ncbi:ComF family protein [Maridesulfovibrio salexigens]|uniref:Phosphoribosyltransferase n=1 Tax=Maridesulfovibrio salexigens (strain ATCC 14822 / DSM 2638 / NCIMB 8403 / VKM B-1763) TaxID=526222 RepID=C6BZL5_MARSD|nr:ComF family protein [Maridesulfovibrio salexigens]ACS78922.1 phosphoribosyltransferase [Maridesulfovibrio salexigens DSM 2638]
MFAQILRYLSPFNALESFKKAFAERRCPACLKIHAEKGLCRPCLASMEAKPENICMVCGNEHNSPDADKLPCISCQTVPRNFSRLYFYGMHQGLLRQMLLDWKFSNQYGYNQIFGQFIASLCADLPKDSHPDLIIPVPLHSSRLRERGFNQSMILARFAATTFKTDLSEQALIRERKTIPQTRLSGAERRTNLHTAFTASPSIVADKRILLIDDVYTTGSTVDECARTLLEAGAARVEVMTLSRALI